VCSRADAYTESAVSSFGYDYRSSRLAAMSINWPCRSLLALQHSTVGSTCEVKTNQRAAGLCTILVVNLSKDLCPILIVNPTLQQFDSTLPSTLSASRIFYMTSIGTLLPLRRLRPMEIWRALGHQLHIAPITSSLHLAPRLELHFCAHRRASFALAAVQCSQANNITGSICNRTREMMACSQGCCRCWPH
jgi:hypothetical protein